MAVTETYTDVVDATPQIRDMSNVVIAQRVMGRSALQSERMIVMVAYLK
jgi:hypothetical protein